MGERHRGLLDYDTELTLEESDDTGTHVRGSLGTGAVWARVEKVFGKGEYYTIKTQNAVAVVRGTSFSISYRNNVSKIEVAAGTVRFMPVDPSTGEPIESKEVFVSTDNKATIDVSGTVRVSPLTAVDKQASWYLFNAPENARDNASGSETSAPAAPQTAAQSVSQTDAPQPKPTPSEATAPLPTESTASAENACASFSESQGYTGSRIGGSLKLTSVSPLSVSQSGQDTVTLTGEGFLCAATITIGKNVLDGESDFVVVSNASLTLSSGLLPIGTFDIVIHDSLGNAATLPRVPLRLPGSMGKRQVIAALAFFAALIAGAFQYFDILASWQEQVFDRFFTTQTAPTGIIIIGIDDQSISARGGWYARAQGLCCCSAESRLAARGRH